LAHGDGERGNVLHHVKGGLSGQRKCPGEYVQGKYPYPGHVIRSPACRRKIAVGRLTSSPPCPHLQQIHNKSTTLRQVVQQAVQQIHNKSYKWSLSLTASLKSPGTTSYKSSIDTVALNRFFAFWCQDPRWRISSILDFRGPIMSSLNIPCVTSYRSSIDTCF